MKELLSFLSYFSRNIIKIVKLIMAGHELIYLHLLVIFVFFLFLSYIAQEKSSWIEFEDSVDFRFF